MLKVSKHLTCRSCHRIPKEKIRVTTATIIRNSPFLQWGLIKIRRAKILTNNGSGFLTSSSLLSQCPKLPLNPMALGLGFLQTHAPTNHPLHLSVSRRNISSTRLNAAGLYEIEPDLNEDKCDRWRTGVIDPVCVRSIFCKKKMWFWDFIYGEYDGHHTYHEEDHQKKSFRELVKEEYVAAEPPTGIQGIISWLFPPAVIAAMYYNIPEEYLYIGAAISVVFCIIEMDKPDKSHNFEPQIYNMERGARDKLIADYNTMDIWDFNEKYGELWDLTVGRTNLDGF